MKSLMSDFYLLTPTEVVKVWGGSKLKELRGLQGVFEGPIGETWEISTHQDGQSKVGNAFLEEVLGKQQLDFLVKLIDTEQVLSVQVHPNNEYSLLHENQRGKTECWLILDAEPEAGVYLGFNQQIDSQQFKDRVNAGEDISSLLNFIPAKRGDFFYVPAGTIHALGKGLLLMEVQQSSGVTYRVWDWNRKGLDGKARELHIDKACDVLNFEKSLPEDFGKMRAIFEGERSCKLAEHEDFTVELHYLDGSEPLSVNSEDHFLGITNITGHLSIKSENEEIHLSSLQSVLCEKSRLITISGNGYLMFTK